jgi:hypothetical protein
MQLIKHSTQQRIFLFSHQKQFHFSSWLQLTLVKTDRRYRKSREKSSSQRRPMSLTLATCRTGANQQARWPEFKKRSFSAAAAGAKREQLAVSSVQPPLAQHCRGPRKVGRRLKCHVTRGQQLRHQHRPRSLPVNGWSSRDDLRINGYARPDSRRTSYPPASRVEFWINWE